MREGRGKSSNEGYSRVLYRLLMHETEARALRHVDCLCIIGPRFFSKLRSWRGAIPLHPKPHASPEQLARRELAPAIVTRLLKATDIHYHEKLLSLSPTLASLSPCGDVRLAEG